MKKSILILSSALVCAVSASAQIGLIAESFDGLTADQILFTGAKYDFTNGAAFDIAQNTPNTLGFYAGSSSTFEVKADPLDSGNLTLWLSGSDNHANPGRGIYMMRLDPTGGGTFTTGEVTVSYSFRMMRDGTNAASPTSFDVAWVSRPAALDDGSENLDMFTWTGETVHQSFTTSGDSDTWVTVAGSITADLSTLDTTSPYSTGIRIDPTNGGFVTGSGKPGIYYVDDFSVSVSAVPEPSTYALLAGIATLGLVLLRRRQR